MRYKQTTIISILLLLAMNLVKAQSSCDMPCFIGLRPGITVASDATVNDLSLYFDDTSTVELSTFDGKVITYWTYNEASITSNLSNKLSERI